MTTTMLPTPPQVISELSTSTTATPTQNEEEIVMVMETVNKIMSDLHNNFNMVFNNDNNIHLEKKGGRRQKRAIGAFIFPFLDMLIMQLTTMSAGIGASNIMPHTNAAAPTSEVTLTDPRIKEIVNQYLLELQQRLNERQ